jgi:hypothetical protein
MLFYRAREMLERSPLAGSVIRRFGDNEQADNPSASLLPRSVYIRHLVECCLLEDTYESDMSHSDRPSFGPRDPQQGMDNMAELSS